MFSGSLALHRSPWLRCLEIAAARRPFDSRAGVCGLTALGPKWASAYLFLLCSYECEYCERMFDPADNLSPADPHAHAAVCFLEAIGDGDTTDVFKRAAQSDALNWITRTLEFGVNIVNCPLKVRQGELSDRAC
jgi:hypothetical protein